MNPIHLRAEIAANEAVIRFCEEKIQAAETLGKSLPLPLPANLRRATLADIYPGVVIWHTGRNIGVTRWRIVDEAVPNEYASERDDAYISSGNIYGLWRAHVECSEDDPRRIPDPENHIWKS